MRGERSCSMLSNQWLNILIVGIYFVFLIVIGWMLLCKKIEKTLILK